MYTLSILLNRISVLVSIQYCYQQDITGFFSLDVTVSSNSELEQLHIKSSDTSIPAPLAHNYLLSAQTSDDIKQWYKALQESRLLDNVVLNCRKRSHPSYNSREVCIYSICVSKFYLFVSVATK